MNLSLDIPLSIKLSALLVMMLLGFSITGFIAYDNSQRMKKSLDLVYFGSYIQVLKLETIRHTYIENVVGSVVKYKQGMQQTDETLTQLKNALASIREEWNYYKNTYKTEEEKKFVINMDMALKDSFSWIEALIKAYESGDSEKINTISISGLYARAEAINVLLEDLAQYEKDSAYLQKNKINRDHSQTQDNLFMVLGALVLSAIGLSFIIIRNIKQNHEVLEETTQELKFANAILKNISITDPLTQLYNRRYFNAMFEKEIRRAAREEKYFSFIMLDIDHFKQFNDTYGHKKGDEALQRVAERLKSLLKRPSDYAFRLGGEEFGIMLYDMDKEQAVAFAEKIRHEIETTKIPHEKNSASKFLTISLGLINLLPSQTIHPDFLMVAADEALYAAKESGRNQVRLADESKQHSTQEEGKEKENEEEITPESDK